MGFLRDMSLAVAVVAGSMPAAYAAALIVDDTDPANITVSANDFEEGLYIDGNLVQLGLNNPQTITLPDTGHSFEGRWIDLGQTTSGQVFISFALASDPTGVTSGIEFATSSDGSLGTVTGSFGGFNGTPYFTASPTFLQDGHTEYYSLPFLGMEFHSEPVPEPATYGLMLLGLAALGWAARNRSR